MPSQEVLKSDMRAQVRAYLAAEMWVPWSKTTTDDHVELHQRGKQFLLRKDCGWYTQNYYGEIVLGSRRCKDGMEFSTARERDTLGWTEKECRFCNRLGYLFDDSPDALWDAVRAKLWEIEVSAVTMLGTMVTVNGNPHVAPREGLRGQAAIELAVARALGWEK